MWYSHCPQSLLRNVHIPGGRLVFKVHIDFCVCCWLTWKVCEFPCIAVPQLELHRLWCWLAQCHIHSHILSNDGWWTFKQVYLNGKQGYCVGGVQLEKALWTSIAVTNMDLWSNLPVDRQCPSSIQGTDDWHTAWNEIGLKWKFLRLMWHII